MREAVHNYIDIVDEQGLRMVYAMLKEYSLPAELSSTDDRELQLRRKKYKAGTGRTLTVAEFNTELKKRIVKK